MPGGIGSAGAVAGRGAFFLVLEAQAEVDVQLLFPGELVVEVARVGVLVVVADAGTPVAVAHQAVVGERAEHATRGLFSATTS
jgi:hypothetical protein